MKFFKKGIKGYMFTGYLLVAPYLLFLVVFYFFPLIVNVILSFTNYDLSTASFIGIKNFLNILKDKFFLLALRNTLFYTFFSLALSMGFGLVFAVILNQKIWGTRFYRTCFFLPHVTSMVAVSMIWLWMYEPAFGIFNRILAVLGLPKQAWLVNPALALPCLVAMNIWKTTGYNMVVYLAGLQGIPNELYQAATIDGASELQKFFTITFPMLQPVHFFLVITGLVLNINVFEQVNVMTKGGPRHATTTLVHQVYIRAFGDYLVGYAAAIALVLLLILVLITLVNFRLGKQGYDISL
jgi:ABC-type sugar transport system permease subunit